MRKHGFLAGVCTTLLVLALGTSALAASGKVSFNFASVSLNGETKITAGSDITVANGEKVPGSILYTDAKGGKTNYLPIRAISELLDVDIDYDGATRTVELLRSSLAAHLDGGRLVSRPAGHQRLRGQMDLYEPGGRLPQV